MRTKLFSILMALMLLPGFARALDYTQASSDISSFNSHLWSDVANCNAQLKVDDVVIADDNAAARYVVLAYVNGSLRGYQDTPKKYQPATGGPSAYIYQTSIWANASTETGEAITFYVLDKTAQKVYQASHTHTWAVGTLEMPSSGGMIIVSTKVLVSQIKTTNSTVYASDIDSSIFPSSNYASMYDWCVDLTPYYTVLPDDATDRSVTVTWDYTKDGYAVEQASNGKWYMFVATPGSYTVTIHANDRSAVSADLTLNVKFGVTSIMPYNPETVFRQDIITNGYDISNKFDILPSDASDKSVTYELVTGKTTCAGTLSGSVFKPAADGKGEVYVKIISVSNPTVSDEYHFTVAVKVEDLVLQNSTKTMKVGDSETITGWYSLSPSDAVGDVSVTSNDATIAKVDNTSGSWKITALAAGTATLSFSVPTGERDVTGAPITIDKTMTLTVVQPVTSITLNPKFTADDYVVWRKEAIASPVRISQNYYYFVNPDNATNQAVTMSLVSGYESMGTLTHLSSADLWTFKPAATAKGDVKIKIASVDNPSISVILTLTVKVAVESITFNPSAMTVAVDGETPLMPLVTVLPEEADDHSVAFSVDKSAVGIVNSYGRFVGLTAGTVEVTATSVQNPEISGSMTFTVKSKCAGITIAVDENADYDATDGSRRLALGEARSIQLTPTPAGCYFDDSKLNISYVFGGTLPTGWTGADVAYDGSACSFTPKVPGAYTLTISYTNPDGTSITKSTNLYAYPAVDLASGWNWIGSDAVTNVSTVVKEFDGALVETRTQSIYLVNDPSWGYISDNGNNDIDLKASVDNGHFRIKTDKAVKSLIEGTYDYKGGKWTVTTGWNWVNNPIYYSVPLTKLNGLSGFNDGDILKGKDGSLATYTGGKWTGTLTALVEGKAYSLQSKAAGAVTINFSGVSFDQVFTPASSMHAPQLRRWSYDGSRFMTNMSIIAEIDQIDYAEDYSIGAFVNGECRGEGKYVDGRWYVFAHGEAGDRVELKLMNTITGSIIDLNETFSFAEIAGSYQAPVMLTVDTADASGIADIIYGGNISGDDVEIYDINGRNFTGANGNLQPGLYIVKSNGITKKVTVK